MVSLTDLDSGPKRTGVLVRGVLTSFVSRGVAALAPIVTIPIALQFLGVEEYGAWAAALALTSLALFADLGLGVGLMTRLTGVLASGDLAAAKRLVSTAYATLILFVLILIGLLWTSTLFFDWASVVGGGSREIAGIVVVTLTVFLVNIPLSLIVRVQYATQEIARSNLWQAAAAVVGIASMFIAVHVASSAEFFIAVAAAGQVTVVVLNTAVFFGAGTGRRFRPSLAFISLKSASQLMLLGLRFLVISVLLSAVMSTDALLVANAVGLDAVPDLAIPARVFALLSVVVSVLTVPLWPMNAAAIATGDLAWVRRTTRNMTVIGVGIVAVLGLVGVLVAPWALGIWLDGEINPSVWLLTGLACVAIVQAVAAPAFMVQNAVEVLLPQTVGYLLMLICLPIKWWVAQNAGVDWVPWVTALAYVLIVLPATLVGYRRALVISSERASRD